MTIALRPAGSGDCEAVTDLFIRSRSIALPFLPDLHSRDETLAYLGQFIATGEMTLATPVGDELTIAGMMVTTPGWLDHLYLDPDWRGRGIGAALLAQAKAAQPVLSLWCFAENHAAQRFYRGQGFVEQRRTAGDNEEQLPDILYGWTRPDWLRDRP
jgi:GNAT superfamily N-acetyltransferase